MDLYGHLSIGDFTLIECQRDSNKYIIELINISILVHVILTGSSLGFNCLKGKVTSVEIVTIDFKLIMSMDDI